MNAARTIGERLTLACLRLAATLVTFAGLGLLTATLATTAAPFTGTLARLFPAHAFRFAAVLLAAGGLALFLAAARGALFGAERLDSRARRATPDAWTWVMALAVVAAPAWLAWRFVPMAALWRDALAMLDRFGVWDMRGDMGMSGFILAPLFAAVALPAFETLSAAAFVAACVLLLLLLATGSRLRLRAVLVCATLTGALAMASLLADDTMRQLLPVLAREIRASTTGHPDESAQALAALARYQRVTGDAARALAWAWFALGACVPFLVLRGLADARALAASRASAPDAPPRPHDVPAPAVVTPAVAPAGDRERFYADAARLVRDGGPGGGGGALAVGVLVVVALLGLFALVSGFGALAAISRLVTR